MKVLVLQLLYPKWIAFDTYRSWRYNYGGTYDDNVRHSISALSSLFITTNQAKRYLLKNDIHHNRIINCGIFTGENYFSIKNVSEIVEE